MLSKNAKYRCNYFQVKPTYAALVWLMSPASGTPWLASTGACVNHVTCMTRRRLSVVRNGYIMFRAIGFFNEADTLESSSVLIY